MLLAGCDEQGHGEKISRPSGAEPTRDEALVDAPGALAPGGLAYAAIPEELARRGASKAKAGQASPMQKIGVLDGSDERKAGFDPRCLAIAGKKPGPPVQRGKADPMDAGKAKGRLPPSAPGTVAPPDPVAMAERFDAII